MATSTIGDTKDALFDLLLAEPGLAGVQIEWARPTIDAIQQEAVWFEGTDSTQLAEAIGNQRRDERFTLTLIVSIANDGDDARATERRMWAIAAEIEQLVRDHPKPIPAPLFDIQWSSTKQRPIQAEGQRLSEAAIEIAGRARV